MVSRRLKQTDAWSGGSSSFHLKLPPLFGPRQKICGRRLCGDLKVAGHGMAWHGSLGWYWVVLGGTSAQSGSRRVRGLC